MKKRELKIKVVLETIEESKKQVAAISDSVGPVSSTRETLIKVDAFIQEMEKEVVQSLSEEKRVPKYKHFFIFTSLLMPFARLLTDLLAEARQIIEHFLR